MTIDLTGRVAIVTGAGGGLGRSHALALAECGSTVVVNDLGSSGGGEGADESPADAVVAEIRQRGGSALASYASVASSAGAGSIVDAAVSAFGRLDIVVSNAGILRDRTVAKVSDDELRAVLDVHLLGSIYMTRAAWPHLIESGDGRLIVTSSAAGLWGNFGQTAYAAAKAGIVGAGLTAAAEGRKVGIKANVIAPFARTRLTEEQFGEEVSKLLEPDLVSALVVALCAPGLEVTGEVFSVGGGRFARVATASSIGVTVPPEEVSPEMVLSHLDRIRDLTGCAWPTTANDDLRLLVRAVRARTTG